MAIPKFEDFLYPFLYRLKDMDNVSIKDMKKSIIEHFHLSEEDCKLRPKSGSTNQLDDRLGWSRQWLRRALFIEIPQRGIYKITKRGVEYLQNHTDLRQTDLMKYPEYAEYATTSSGTTKKTAAKVIEELEESKQTQTPTEQLENAYQSIIKDLAADLLQKVLEQSAQFFEHLVLDLLLKMGYGGSLSDAGMVTKYSHDDGIDGIIKEDKLGLDKIYIQAKRYNTTNTIGKPQIQQFVGALDEQKASKGVFITTSSYSSEARKYAEEKASKKIVLIDGQELARYMIEYNVGVSLKRVYEVKRIDSDYFEDDNND